MLWRMPLVPEVSPRPPAERCNVWRLTDQHPSRRQHVPNRLQHATNVREVFDDVEEMYRTNAPGLDVLREGRLIALIGFDAATSQFLKRPAGDVRADHPVGAAEFLRRASQ